LLATWRVTLPSLNCSAASPSDVLRAPGKYANVRAAPLKVREPPKVTPAACASVAP
jgi:hypothetical protein